jgi:hypothetical protein
VGRLQAEEGVGLVSSVAGVMVFLAFLLLAAQVLVHLFATSYVNAAAFDAARLASGSAGVTEAAAAEHGLKVLGSFAGRVSVFTVDIAVEAVHVHVEADSPALLPAAFGRVVGSTAIDRVVVLRREVPQCAGC